MTENPEHVNTEELDGITEDGTIEDMQKLLGALSTKQHLIQQALAKIKEGRKQRTVETKLVAKRKDRKRKKMLRNKQKRHSRK